MKPDYHNQKLSSEVKKYLKSIGKKLRLPRKTKQSVLSDLATGMLARVEAGESMEQVIKDMGSPLQVATAVNEEMDDLVYVKSPWRWACLALVVCCALVLLMEGYLGVLMLLANGMVRTVGMIGSIDGPTQIYVTTTPEGNLYSFLMAFLLLIMGIVGFVRLSHCQKKQE